MASRIHAAGTLRVPGLPHTECAVYVPSPDVILRAMLRRAIGLVALAALAPWGAPAADEGLSTPMLNNVRAQGWIQFGVNSGRIVVSGAPGVNFSHTGPASAERREQLSVRVNGAVPVISYKVSGPRQQLLLDATGNRLQIRRLPKADRSEPVAVEFQQAPGEPLCLTVGPKEHQRTYRGPTLWHLFLLEPAVSSERLAPLLAVILRETDFARTAQEIEATLVRTAATGTPPDQKRWAVWLEQLADPRFAVREAADRKFREEGRIVVTYLQQLDASRLDAEQRYRVRRILQSLSESGGDESPAQIAHWLAGDPAVWLALLSRDDASTRRLVAKRLATMLGGPIDFNPAADRPARQKQIEALRARILGN
jgi:hypothetical protein